ncbi:MAG: hypothetical protein MZW92_66030 [Comamonadaceae bacterium]|nr:hypothetical protein [Comamonadaceae bacterium]
MSCLEFLMELRARCAGVSKAGVGISRPAAQQDHREAVDLDAPAETAVVDVTVFANLFPDWGQVRVATVDGKWYVITPETPGVQAQTLREGQRLRCEVSVRVPKVLFAELLDST